MGTAEWWGYRQSLTEKMQEWYTHAAEPGLVVISVLLEDRTSATATLDTAAPWRDRYGLHFPVLADVDGQWRDAYSIEGDTPQRTDGVVDSSGLLTFLQADGSPIPRRDRVDAVNAANRPRPAQRTVVGADTDAPRRPRNHCSSNLSSTTAPSGLATFQTAGDNPAMYRPLPIGNSMTSAPARALPIILSMCAAAASASGCKKCEKGYELQADGTCYAEVVVGSETWDTGSEDRSDQLTEPSTAEVQGEIQPGDVDLTSATDLSVELWLDQEMDIYGPDRNNGQPAQQFSADLAALQAGNIAEFTGEHPGIPLRGRDVFLFVRLDWSDRAQPSFFEADANPYLLRQEASSDRVVIQLDSSTVED